MISLFRNDKSDAAEYAHRDDLIFIPIGALRSGYSTDFDLYLPPRDALGPVLYAKADSPFSEERRKRLEEFHVKRLCVRTEDATAYRRYIEQHLGAILADEQIPLEERCSTLYHAAQDVMYDVMREPRAGDMLKRSTSVVQHTLAMMRNNPSALLNLMKVTSFDYYTYTHSVNVFMFSVALARRLNFNEDEMQRFGLGVLLHDIGKSKLSPALLNFRGKLDDQQWAEMKQHPRIGWEMLKEQGIDDPLVLGVVRSHHEKLSGTGYPDGLKGDEITPWVRVTTIADIFDALTTRRSYKDALNSFPSLKLMQDEMNNELDPGMLRAFIRMIGNPGA